MTSSLPRKRSTPELRRRKVFDLHPLKKEEISAYTSSALGAGAGMTFLSRSERETGFPSTPLGINFSPLNSRFDVHLERETGFEPATFSLEG